MCYEECLRKQCFLRSWLNTEGKSKVSGIDVIISLSPFTPITLTRHNKWTCTRDLKKARQVDYQKIQRKFRKEKKDIEKYTNIITEAEQQLYVLLQVNKGSGSNNGCGTNPSFGEMSKEVPANELKLPVNEGSRCFVGLYQNVQIGNENQRSDLPPAVTECDTCVSHLFTNGTSNPPESLSVDAAESPHESVAEPKLVQATKRGTSLQW
jgi:hypothetical protein